MRAVFCFYGPNILGGPTTWVRRMLPRLAQRGLDVSALSYQTTEGDCTVVADLRAAGIPVDVVDAAGLAPWDGCDGVLAALAARRPDVLIADHVLPAFIAGAAMSVPTVMTLRSDDDLCNHLLDRFVIAGDMRVAAVAAVSHELTTRTHRLSQETTICVVHCPDGSIFPEERARWRAQPFHAVYMGRLEDQQKRIHATLDALIATSRSLPYFSATVYGDGPLRAEVEDRLRPGNGHAISYGGCLKPPDVFPHLLNAQAMVLLSAYEGLSSSIQEAMACGLPVIARRTASGVEGVLLHDETALVLDDDSQLQGAVERLAESEHLWRRLSIAGRELAHRKFDIERIADRWCDLLTRVGARRSPSEGAVPAGAEAYLRYLRRKSPLEDYEEDFVITHGTHRREVVRHLTESAADWETRRCRFYRVIERNVLTPDDVRHVANALAESADKAWASSATGMYCVASLLRLAGRDGYAAALFEQVAATSTDLRSGSLYHLATIAHAEGRHDDALAHAEACLDANPAHRAASALRDQLARPSLVS